MKRLILLGAFLFVFSASPARAVDRIVHQGDDLQAVINVANPGDVIKLDPGAVFVGNYTLPPKQSNGLYVTIQTGTLANLPLAGLRISPAHAASMAKIRTPNGTALTVSPGASFYKIIGIEFGPETTSSNVAEAAIVSVGLNTPAQTLPELAPHHVEVDRCYVHGNPGQQVKRGIALHSGEVSVLNCYVADIHLVGQDSNGITGANGPGPYHIINNYVEAAAENIIFGGEPLQIPGTVPSDIEVRRNYLYKPLTWRPNTPGWDGHRWVVKNLFELKTAKRVIVEGNVMENQWGDVDDNYGAINLTVSGGDSGAQATLQHITVTNNIVRHVGRGILISGLSDGGAASVPCDDLVISNNIFEDVNSSKWHHDGNWIVFPSKFDNVKIRHNTVIESSSIMVIGSPPNTSSSGFEMTDNIFNHTGCCGVIGAGFGIGQTGLEFFAPGAILRRNVMIGGASSAPDYSHFTDNTDPKYFPDYIWLVGFFSYLDNSYRLKADSPFKSAATDGKDIGVDHDALKAATGLPESPTNSTTDTYADVNPKMYWTDNSSDELGFEIEMSNPFPPYDSPQRVTVGANVTSFAYVQPCNPYFSYRVRAFNAAGYSGFSDTVTPCVIATPVSIVEDVVWKNLYSVTASGNSLYKANQTYYWDAGAVSTRSIASGDGYAEVVPNDVGGYRMFGLGNGDTGPNLTDIDFALALGSGSLAVYESGAFRGPVGTYAPGDRLRVAVEGGVVKYYKNGALLYTSTVAPVYPLMLDTSLSTSWSSVTNARIGGNNITGPVTQPVVWTNVTGSTASGNNLYKTNQTYFWDAGAVSTKAIASGDGYVEVTPNAIGGYCMFGLGNGDSGPNLTDLDFALSLGSGSLAIYESGVYRGGFGTYAAGDKLRVAVEGGVVKYYKNGALVYTSTIAPAYPLMLDTSLSSSWSSITNAYISGVLTP